MAARKTKGTKDKPWPQITRDRIRGSMIYKRLENHILTTPEDEDFAAKYMSSSQVTAALGMLKKVLPDLTSTDGKVEQTHTLTFADVMKEIEGKSRGLPKPLVLEHEDAMND